jgi:two-component system, OmpR family, sensor histidine kinase KdpD
VKRPGSTAAVVLSLCAVALTTAGARLAGVNAPTAGFLFLLVVLFSATAGGLAAGIAASITATTAFNYFFLPPFHTFHIADAENWVALGIFLVVSVVASRLVTNARREAERAGARATEVQTLYDLSMELFFAASSAEALARVASKALVATGARQGAIALFEGEGEESWFGTSADGPDPAVRDRARSIRIHRQTLEFPADDARDLYVPLGTGEPRGVLVAIETAATRAAVESTAQLLTLAMEREQLLAERAHVDALQESESMKTALLRAVSHDLATPLTAITVQVASLQRQLAGQPTAKTLGLLADEVGRLKRRIDNLLSMARLETGSVAPRPEPIPPADLFRAARENLGAAGAFTVRVEPGCPDAFADPSLALEIIVNLVENARRASPPGETVELVAEADPDDPERVRLGVLDRGVGIGEPQDAPPRGLGLEIARRFAQASGGDVSIRPRSGGGSCAWVSLPCASSPGGGAVAAAAHPGR